jgi:hypothetical protein
MREFLSWLGHPEEPKDPLKPEIGKDDDQQMAGGSAPDAEEREELERAIDAKLDAFLGKHVERFNQGNSGLILKFDLRDVPEELKADLEAAGISLGNEQVVKILKIFDANAIEQEFARQARAHEIVENSGKDEVAKVPRPHFCRELEVSPETAAKIRSLGDNVRVRDKVGMMFMDKVDGEDIATILYKEYVRRDPAFADIAQRLDERGESYTIEELMTEIVQRTSVPGREPIFYAPVEGANKDPERVMNQNFDRLRSELMRRGFRLHPSIVRQIRNTMDLFHENGLVFRDGHHRNFMVSGDVSAAAEQPPQVHAIDYGGSKTFEGDYEDQKEKLYSKVGALAGQEGRFPDDDYVANSLEPLTREMDVRDVDGKIMDELRTLLAKGAGNKAVDAMRTKLAELHAGGSDTARAAALLRTKNGAGPDGLKRVLMLVMEGVENGSIDAGWADDLLGEVGKTAGASPEPARVRSALKKKGP